jgi:hypothetical protein
MAMRDDDETHSWAELMSGLGTACGGLLLALEAAIVIPGLAPAVALGAVLLLPFVAAGAILAIVIGVPLAALRLAARALRP